MKSRVGQTVCAFSLAGLLLAGPAAAATLPSTSSATLTYHIDASQLNAQGGAVNPGNGNDITTWNELTTGTALDIQGTPSWHAGGINGQPVVRFSGEPGYSDLVYSNHPDFASVQARTIFVVASMADNGRALSGLIADSTDNNNIRQSDTEIPAYFPGNSGDFHTNSTFNINGTARYDIPGGFDVPHVVKAVSLNDRILNSVRIGSNVAERTWAGDVSEVLIFDGVLNGNDLAQVNKYLTEKYAITQVVDEKITDTSVVAAAPFGGQAVRSIGVDFNYGGGAAPAFKGIGFDGINLETLDGGGNGNFVLNANTATAGTTLALSLPFTEDFSSRGISGTATGDDAASINALTGNMFYLSGGHPEGNMVFGNLPALTEVYVQAFGGHNNWNGHLNVSINGGEPLEAQWNTVTASPSETASIFGFFAQTDASGNLTLNFKVAEGNFGAIGGMILHVVPEPSSLGLLAAGTVGLAALRRRRG